MKTIFKNMETNDLKGLAFQSKHIRQFIYKMVLIKKSN